jgi:hypothetical protein
MLATMSLPLEPCPSCRRHVRAESACPFCAAPLDTRVVVATVARVALAVALTAGGVAAAASCAPAAVYGGPPPGFDRGGDAAAPGSADPAKPPVDTSPTATQRAPAPMYGAPPPPEHP